MKKINVFLALAMASFLVSCGPSQKITSSWVSPEKRELTGKYKVFIAAMVSNTSYKNIIEDELAKAATANGHQVIRSAELFAPTFTKENAPNKHTIMEAIQRAGCDFIFTVALTDRQSETRYVPGSTTYSPYMGYGGMGFGGYYGYMYPTMYSTPGYYTEDKTYFMEARLFDAKTEEMVWSAQSEAYNPGKISKEAKNYATMLVERMQKDLGIKK